MGGQQQLTIKHQSTGFTAIYREGLHIATIVPTATGYILDQGGQVVATADHWLPLVDHVR